MKLRIESQITHYSWDSTGEAFQAIAKWVEKDLIREDELPAIICQMFYQIPDEVFNDVG